MVPSSPNGPCSRGNTTSTCPSTCGTSFGASVTRSRSCRPCDSVTAVEVPASASTLGRRPSVIRQRSGSSAARKTSTPDRSAIGSNPERRFASGSSRNLARKP